MVEVKLQALTKLSATQVGDFKEDRDNLVSPHPSLDIAQWAAASTIRNTVQTDLITHLSLCPLLFFKLFVIHEMLCRMVCHVWWCLLLSLQFMQDGIW